MQDVILLGGHYLKVGHLCLWIILMKKHSLRLITVYLVLNKTLVRTYLQHQDRLTLQHLLRHQQEHQHRLVHHQEHRQLHLLRHQQEHQPTLRQHRHNRRRLQSTTTVLLVLEVLLEFMLMEYLNRHTQHWVQVTIQQIQSQYSQEILSFTTVRQHLWVVQDVRFTVQQDLVQVLVDRVYQVSVELVTKHLIVILKHSQWEVTTSRLVTNSHLILFNRNDNLKYKTPSNRGFLFQRYLLMYG